MAKKKKNVKSDGRGYSNLPNNASERNTHTCTVSVNAAKKCVDKKSEGTVVTATLHQNLENLLELLQQIFDDNAINNDTSELSVKSKSFLDPEKVDKRLVKRVSNLLVSLVELDFSIEQIKVAVSAIGVEFTEETVIDWLCLHFPTDELPPRFTEGQVREASRSNSSITSVPTVIAPISSQAIRNNEQKKESVMDSVGEDTDICRLDSLSEPINKSIWDENQGANIKKPPEEDDASKAAKTAWLISQYQYEESLESLEIGEAFPSSSLTSDSLLGTKEDPLTFQSNNIPEDLTKEEILLNSLKKQLLETEADANDEASNYMRSKHEVKELQKKVQNIRQKVKGMERKVEKQRAASLQLQDQYVILSLENVDHSDSIDQKILTTSVEKNNVTEMQEDTEGFSSLFDEDTAAENGKDKEGKIPDNVPSDIIDIPKDSIPEKWTGTTPKIILADYCRKEKFPRPIFEKLSMNGCHLKVKLGKVSLKEIKNIVSIDVKGPVSTYENAQQYASTLALYKINPILPLYRLFPPFYRSVWMSWIDEKNTEKANIEGEVADKHMEQVKEIIACIPVDSSLPKRSIISEVADKIDTNREDISFECIEDAEWDDDEVSLAPTEVAPSALCGQPGIEYQKRLASVKYQDMMTARKSLPIYPFRQNILDTIRNNHVTIISAETGSGKTTQCSSFILEEALQHGFEDNVSILCTQPRRVATISVAERVADELGEDSVGKLVGYQIRLEAKRSSMTKLLFCTTGVVLRRLIEDPTLKGISHVVVDECHERQWQIDCLLVSLRSLIRNTRPDLKVILVSIGSIM